MMLNDSVTKIVESYFQVVTAESFYYKDKLYEPKELVVSPLIFRGYTCPASCGGCCSMKFSLDYIPSEFDQLFKGTLPPTMKRSIVDFNNKPYLIYSDFNQGHTKNSCRNLREDDGRCDIYEQRPFSCDFELIRSIKQSTKNYLTQKLYGRGWAMRRVDGERGAKCEMTPPTEETKQDVVRKLLRLKEWTDYFELETHLPLIIEWAKYGPYGRPLVFNVGE